MNESLVPVVVGGVIGGGFAIVGSLITGWLTYVSSVRKRETELYRRHLIQAYEDIAAFHRLEERYVEKLAEIEPSKTPVGWKRSVRREQMLANIQTPSKDATARYADHEVQRLRDKQAS